jgi:hypothetical protein
VTSIRTPASARAWLATGAFVLGLSTGGCVLWEDYDCDEDLDGACSYYDPLSPLGDCRDDVTRAECEECSFWLGSWGCSWDACDVCSD